MSHEGLVLGVSSKLRHAQIYDKSGDFVKGVFVFMLNRG